MQQRKTAIVGAGLTGAYLYRLLKNLGIAADLYDRKRTTACGLTPCAWGTSHGFEMLAAAAGLSAHDYLLHRFDCMVVDGVKIYADLKTLDKPRLIDDLLGSAPVETKPPAVARYDRVIDATGTARALLPPAKDDVLLGCRQYLLEGDRELAPCVKLIDVGYAWRFPLGGGRHHVGCGSLVEDPQAVLRELGWLQDGTMRCGCAGDIRIMGPLRSQPVVHGNAPEIIGVGEAIGCVAPLVGDGIVPGMRSAALLVEHWEDPPAYRDALLKEFRWMEDERRVVDALLRKEVGLREAMVVLKNCRRMRMRLGPLQALTLLKNLTIRFVPHPATRG